METYTSVMDYIIEQVENNDVENLKFENEAINNVLDLVDQCNNEVINIIDIISVRNQMEIELMLDKISRRIKYYYTLIAETFDNKLQQYYKKGYDDVTELINIGLEMETKLSEKIKEQRKKEYIYDKNTIEYMRDHAFEKVTKISTDVMSELRSKLGELLIQDKLDKKSIEKAVKDILGSTTSRAKMIAQTELSMAYNYGVIQKINEFNEISDKKMMKYWYGFKYSQITCNYCRPRIGNVYDVNDNTEVLPAHPRCRCVWLPYVEGWDKPIPSEITRKADMLLRANSIQDIYNKINKRLGINYAQYLSKDDAINYILGDRSKDMISKLSQARKHAIDYLKTSEFDISAEDSKNKMGKEFNTQFQFWKELVSQAIIDNDKELLRRSYKAVKGIMVLPWSGQQLNKWDRMLDIISKYMK